MSHYKTVNYAGSGYRDAEVKLEQLGDDGFRTAIIDGGNALLNTKGGMPRVTPLKKKIILPCMDTRSPLSELDAAANREYWEPPGTDPEERAFSIDGLLSLPKRVVKTIKTTSFNAPPESPARPVSIRFAHGTTSAVTRPGDLVEDSRVLGTKSIPAWFKCGLAFVSKECVEMIKFTMGNCPVTLNFKAKLVDPFGSHTGINGLYNVTTETPIPFGASSLDFVNGGKRLSINMEAGQTFLEPYSYKVALALRGGELLPKEQDGDVMVGAFFSMDKWGSPFKCFAHSTGLYVDETRQVKITKPDPKSFPYGASESMPARYFNFNPTGEDVFIEGTECHLRHDVQFNGGYSYPGTDYPDSGEVYLAPNDHLYRDSTGAIWRISFSMSSISEHVVEVKARLIERVDRFLDPLTTVVARDLVVQQFAPMVVSNYTPAPWFNAMIVDSLPSGREASISINAPQGDNIMNPRDPEVSRLIKCIFSGDGGETGAGVSMVFEQLMTVEKYKSDSWAATPTSGSLDPTGNHPGSIEVPEFGCAYSYRAWENGGYVWKSGTWMAGPRDAPYGLNACILNYPDYITRYIYPYYTESHYNWNARVNIQLVARADDTWEMLRMDYNESVHQLRSDVVFSYTIDDNYFFYCKPMESGDGSMFPGDQQGSMPAAHYTKELSFSGRSETSSVIRCELKYTCGEHSIEGYTEYHGGDSVTNVQHSGSGTYRPGPGRFPAFNCSLSAESTTVYSMDTPFWHKRRQYHRLETANNSASEGAVYDGNRNYVDSGTVGSGDPDEDMFWMNLYPKYVAGNRHTIEYNSDHALPPQPTEDVMIHGIAIKRPPTGYVACDDPRNTRLVLLPTADAGLFF